jgi:hypothetical protein
VRGVAFKKTPSHPAQPALYKLLNRVGLTDEAAEALGISPATVDREWALAKAWLYRRLSPRE